MTDFDQETAWLRDSFTAPLGVEDGAPDPDSCPAPELVWEAAQGGLDPEATREVVEHTATCAACAEEWRLAVALGAGEAMGAARHPELAAVRSQAQLRRRPLPWVGAMAAALVVGTIGLSLYNGGHRVEPAKERGADGGIELLTPDQITLDRRHVRLEWKKTLEARSYDVVVRSPSGETIFFQKKGVTGTEVDVPAANFSALPSASPIYWTVTSNLRSGVTVESDTRTFTLR